jgi:hypothetical protein
MEPFITARLEAGTIFNYTDAVKAVMTNLNQFLGVLVQLYGDLNEVRISELQLIKLK